MPKTEYEIPFKKVAIQRFGHLADTYKETFEPVKEALNTSGVNVLFRTYVAVALFYSVLVFFSTAFLVSLFSIIVKVSEIPLILGLVSLPVLASGITILSFYVYPIYRSSYRRHDIDANIPFAITEMAAIAGSGVPPREVFRIIADFKEFGEISVEAEKIRRNIEVFGMDDISAIREVSIKTPSSEFKELLSGIISTIQSGGDPRSYLQGRAERALFDYRLNRERYIETLSVYADIYTTILIAAPLLFVAILAVLNVIGGTVFGLPINDIINFGVFLFIPLLNIAFLIFIHSSQPRI